MHQRAVDELNAISAETSIMTSNDSGKLDLEIICDRCQDLICDIEDGDSLYALAATADEHLRACDGTGS